MSQFSITKKPNHYPAADITASDGGWLYTNPVSGLTEIIAAIGRMALKMTGDAQGDAMAAPSWTLTMPANINHIEGSEMILTLVSNEPVAVTGKPFISASFGGGKKRKFTYEIVYSTPTSLAFTYVIVAEDVGFLTVASEVSRGTGKIIDLDGEENNLFVVAGAMSYDVPETTARANTE